MDERERWGWRLGALAVAIPVLFLLVVVLNPTTILVGTVLAIFHVAISVLIVAFLCLALVGLASAVWWLGSYILAAVANAETRIGRQLDALRRTLLHAATEFGADFLSVLTGALIFLIQEMLKGNGYTEAYQVSLTVVFTVLFLVSAQLIGSTGRTRRILGIVLYCAPVIAFFAVITVALPHDAIITWLSVRSPTELLVISLAVVSTLMAFVLAFLKSRGTIATQH